MNSLSVLGGSDAYDAGLLASPGADGSAPTDASGNAAGSEPLF